MAETKARILLAEDDLHLGMLVQDALLAEKYEVHLCTNGSDALIKFGSGDYHICILDVMMPQTDGFEVARNIRKTNKDIPIFFLTAKSETQDKIEGFRAGADDYLTKPFSIEELLVRVEALLRRRMGSKNEVEEIEVVQIGLYAYHHKFKTLKIRDSEKRLTKKEASVLDLLCAHRNKPVEKDIILTRVWGNASYFNSRSLDVYITRLRKYFCEDPTVQLQTVQGVGFMLVCA